MRFRSVIRAFALLCLMAGGAQAEGVGVGSDMYTRAFEQWGLFHPHENYCDSGTEVFIAIGGGSTGFCIEKAERGTAPWEEARRTCAGEKKRLPEPGEFQAACTAAPSGFVDATDDYEWVSNFVSHWAGGGGQGLGVPAMGEGACYAGAGGYMARADYVYQYSYAYRCVR